MGCSAYIIINSSIDGSISRVRNFILEFVVIVLIGSISIQGWYSIHPQLGFIAVPQYDVISCKKTVICQF